MSPPPGTAPFPRDRLAGPPAEAARALLGARLVRDLPGGPVEARIVEVEAYGGRDDLASHARIGPTARNAAMFGAPGTAYVYRVYGMYHCLNVVTGAPGQAAAVLVRAAEITAGEEAARTARLRAATAARRRLDATGEAARVRGLPPAALAAGPGRLAAALDVDGALTGLDLCDPAAPLRLVRAAAGDPLALPGARVAAGPRVGIGYAPEPWLSIAWRLADPASPAVSRPRPRGEA